MSNANMPSFAAAFDAVREAEKMLNAAAEHQFPVGSQVTYWHGHNTRLATVLRHLPRARVEVRGVTDKLYVIDVGRICGALPFRSN